MADDLREVLPASAGPAKALAVQWFADFDRALGSGDVDAAVRLFADECYWRDLVAFTWNITTCEGRDDIRAMLTARLEQAKPTHWVIEGEVTEADGIVDAWFTFETARLRGRGRLRLKQGRCWTLLTAATELKGFEERRGPRRERGTEHGVVVGRQSWLERQERERAELGVTVQPYCVIIGGGQGGLGLGARLKQLGVPTLILDKHARPGDAWRKRYKSLCLHDPVWYDHMPYLPFPDHWPVFSPKDKIGNWLEMYCSVMDLNYWSSTECLSAGYDAGTERWTVRARRGGQEVTLHPAQLVLATGMSGVPHMPQLPGAETFKGVQHHSSQHGGGEGFAGKKCVVIGSNNSAHDICADLWENGADVTMVQRSSTTVIKSETLNKLATGALYSEEALNAGITTEKADYMAASVPSRIAPEFGKRIVEKIKAQDAEFYERLRAAGFLLDFGEDESGLGIKYARRGSGYYIDVGASELIADGSIKLRSGVGVSELREHAVVLGDGSMLEADLVVYATGYGSMNGWAEKLISKEVADKVGICWGVGSGTARDPGPWEGELRNMWKPTQQAGLWFHGGNLAQSRFYSLLLALQIKARMEGIPTPVYGLPEVHHAR